MSHYKEEAREAVYFLLKDIKTTGSKVPISVIGIAHAEDAHKAKVIFEGSQNFRKLLEKANLFIAKVEVALK